MITRLVESQIEKTIIPGKAILVLGARQVGKTTLINKICGNTEDKLILNGDEPDIREILSNISSVQLKGIIGNAKTIIIDEAQMINNVGNTLKLIIDYIKDVKLTVSGSSSIDLANKTNEPLTGRKLTYNLFPLSFKEMANHHGLLKEKRLLNTRLLYGYYPEVVTLQGKEELLLKELCSSYLYKDILSFGEIKKPVLLDKMLKAIALQIGNEVSFNELGKITGADKETVEKYIDLLEKAFIVFRLNAFNRNVRNEIKKGKKIYFYDNGIRNAVIGNFQPINLRTDQGALWENFIISERVKYLNYNNFYGSYYFWRTRQQQKIDFIEEVDGKFNAYEFKFNPNKKARFSATFHKTYPVDIMKTISPANIEEFLND